MNVAVLPFADSWTGRNCKSRPIPDYSWLPGTDYETTNDRDSDVDYRTSRQPRHNRKIKKANGQPKRQKTYTA